MRDVATTCCSRESLNDLQRQKLDKAMRRVQQLFDAVFLADVRRLRSTSPDRPHRFLWRDNSARPGSAHPMGEERSPNNVPFLTAASLSHVCLICEGRAALCDSLERGLM